MSADAIHSVDGQTVVWKPTPKQRLALACPARDVLFGGSKGGGKTAVLANCVAPILALAHRKWLATGKKQRNCRIWVFRKNLDDLEDFIVKTFEVYPVLDPEMGEGGWHEKEKYWEFTSGATIEMNHLDGPKDYMRFNGQEVVAILFDEVQFISWEAYAFIVAQLRSNDPDYRKALMVRCTANPGGPHGDWVMRYWKIDEYPDGGEVFTTKVTLGDGREVEVSRAFVRAYLRDNPHLDPTGAYEASLRANWSPEEVRMYLDGDFMVVAGAMFSYLLRPQHFVKSFSIPSTWELLHSTDWGSSNPACTLWGALDPATGCVYIIDELHTPGVTGSIYGEKMREKWARQKWSKDRRWAHDEFWGVIDKQAMDQHNGPATPAAGIMEYGIRLFQADKAPGERITGINQIKERLLLDRFGKPQMVVFEDRCPNLVRSLKGIQSCAPIDPEDYEMKSALAHAADALRFLLMKWPVEKVTKVDPVDAEVMRWNAVLAAQKARGSDGQMGTGYGD